MRRRSREEWEAIIAAQEESGMTVRGYCRREGLNEQSLRNHKLKHLGIRKPDLGWPGFVEVPIRKPEAHEQVLYAVSASTTERRDPRPIGEGCVTVRFANGIAVEIGTDPDRETVAWIMDLVRTIA